MTDLVRVCFSGSRKALSADERPKRGERGGDMTESVEEAGGES